MLGRRAREKAFEHDVLLEIEFLQKRHGDDAARVAAEKALRPENRTQRRLVLEEVVRRLTGQGQPPKRRLFGWMLGG